MNKFYTDTHLAFLRKHFPRLSVEDLAVAFNARFLTDKTPIQIKSTCKRYGIKCGRSSGVINTGRFRLFNDEQVRFIKEQYPLLSREKLTAAVNAKFGLNVRHTQLISFCKNHQIRSGRSGQFKPGHASHNAGTKGLMKPNSGSFKKGNRPINYMPVGTTLVDTNGYHKVKVADPDEWEFAHRRNWVLAHGSIPETHCVVFADGNRDNPKLENLELIPRAELSVRNKLHVNSMPDELKPVAKQLVRLKVRTNALVRNREQQSRTA